jgi:benzoyl-CoA reductase subunit B
MEQGGLTLSKQLWETRPLEIWARAKEIRAKWQRSAAETAARPGAILAQGNTSDGDWDVGFEGLTIVEDNPIGAMMASASDEFARKARLASETRGWGRELCGYVNNCWGCQFLGHEMDGQPFPLRDLCIPFPDVCDQHTKRGQQCMDLSPIPRWGNDFSMYIGPFDAEREKAMVDHKVWNAKKVISDIERIFDKEFDDEKFVNSIKLRNEMVQYGLELAQLMTHIPAPIGQKDLYSFYTLGMLTKGDMNEAHDFWKSLVDEVKWRVDHQIAAVGNERYRWMETHPPAWHYLRYYRYLEQYGAVCIGSQYSHMAAGPLEWKEDGTLGNIEMVPVPEGQEIRNREDAVRAIFTEIRRPQLFKIDEYMRPNELVNFAKAFKADGAIMPLWRSGVGCTLTRKEQALRLTDAGVRVLHYEGNQPGDRTDLDEHQFLDQIDIWMESQGLEKFED